MFFDIHTHNNKPNKNIDKIVNIFPDNSSSIIIKSNLKYSIGIHPCYIQKNILEIELEKVAALSKEDNISAIGEIGLDRLSKTPLDIQSSVFIKQLKIAKESKKPIIIHCVRCYSELLNIRKEFSDLKWIIHGFRGKQELAQQLLDNNIYLSFGQAAISPAPSLYKTIRKVPLNRIFLETDESKLNIADIYEKVSEIKEINIDSLSNAVNLNRTKVFEN